MANHSLAAAQVEGWAPRDPRVGAVGFFTEDKSRWIFRLILDAQKGAQRPSTETKWAPRNLQETQNKPEMVPSEANDEPGRGQRPAREIQNGTGWDQERSRI